MLSAISPNPQVPTQPATPASPNAPASFSHRQDQDSFQPSSPSFKGMIPIVDRKVPGLCTSIIAGTTTTFIALSGLSEHAQAAHSLIASYMPAVKGVMDLSFVGAVPIVLRRAQELEGKLFNKISFKDAKILVKEQNANEEIKKLLAESEGRIVNAEEKAKASKSTAEAWNTALYGKK